jgi:type III pantothenate kinase
MKTDFVADIGNSRIKWGVCAWERVSMMVSLPPHDPDRWRVQFEEYTTSGPHSWVIAGVEPKNLSSFEAWLLERGEKVRVLRSWKELPVEVALDQPASVGLDRLLNVVAAKDRARRDVSIFIVDAGSAVTVDWIDELGIFQGGSIFPGCHIMTKALNDYTALLPLVQMSRHVPSLPGKTTEEAIEAGVFWAVAGGIKAILRQMAERARHSAQRARTGRTRPTPAVFLTGGDAGMLAPAIGSQAMFWPEMTLEGIRIAAERLS